MMLSRIGILSSTKKSSIVKSGLLLYLDAGNPDSYRGSGDEWIDLSKSGYNTTLYGTSFDANTDSILFNGVNSYADAGLIPEIGSSSSEFSIEMWFNPEIATAKSLIQNGSDYNTNTYYLWQQNSNELVFEVWGGSNFDAVTFPRRNYDIQTWYHLVGVWKSGEHLKLYKNADCSQNITWSSGVIQKSVIDGDTNTFIGQRDHSFAFKGSIPIIRLYNKALTSGEVQQNFNAEKNRFL